MNEALSSSIMAYPMTRHGDRHMTARLARLFTTHPQTVGESYFEHMGFALWFSSRLLMAGGAALVHAVLPFLCETTASRIIRELHQRIENRGK